MANVLSHKDLVKLGLHEANQGHSLNQIEADFHEKKIDRKDAIKALKTIDYLKKREERKAKESEATKPENKDVGQKNQKATAEKKSSFWPWLIILILIGVGLYLYFSGTINFDFLSKIANI